MEVFVSLFQQLFFAGLLIAVSVVLYERIMRIKSNIQMGKPLDRTDRKNERMRNMILTAFGQKKMFERPIVGLLHLTVYVGFLIINIEVLEIILDGLTSKHRVLSSLLGSLYPFIIGFFEFVALLVLMACVAFLIRRNIMKVTRFHKYEMEGWPKTDANLILVWEIVLMSALFTMNATDAIIQTRVDHAFAAHYPQVGSFAFSQIFIPLYDCFDTVTLILIERTAWWGHIIGIFGFAVYVTYSKHLHIGLAFPTTYFKNLDPKGEMMNMPEVTKEVKIMMGTMEPDNNMEDGEIGRFGAKDVNDLYWKNLMDSYACTECGRCTSMCPANQTGKALSPRKILMDTRDRVEEVGKNKALYGEDYDDGKSLYGDHVTKEELMACTSCNACVEACPINLDPLNIILQMRRYVAMEESDTPMEWNIMFNNIENNFAPWAMPASDRFKWADELKNEA